MTEDEPEDGAEDTDEGDGIDYARIPCSRCGQLTSYDLIYGDLCFRCCRADNE